MNRSFYSFLFLVLFCCEAKTQTEYITNGSFEQIDSCYGNYANIGQDLFQASGCIGWSNPIASSSDLWCIHPTQSSIQPPLIPGAGYQTPRTGSAMAGFYIGFASYANYREYVQNKLTHTLKSNARYQIDFFFVKRSYALYDQ